MSQFTPGSTPPAGGQRRLTLADFIPVSGIYPVGRLDYDSEGLLLLTNDGRLQNRLAHPKFEQRRTYWVQVEGVVDAEALERLRSGVHVQGYVTRPAQVAILTAPSVPDRVPPIRYRASIPTTWLALTLTEGRNREVRRMTAAVGFPTLRLIRTALGSLTLAELAPGSWRDLSSEELAVLRGF